MAEHEFRPGDDVPRSGIYLVTHNQHRAQHEAVVLKDALKGALFPACKACGHAVRYRMVKSAASIDSDSDFADK